MFSYYIERGIPHAVIEGLDEHEYRFYLASMLAWEDRRTAEQTAKLKWWERLLVGDGREKRTRPRRR